ncbi:MAG: protein-tyrosine phosphatase family protein [Chloroflexota bacterium]
MQTPENRARRSLWFFLIHSSIEGYSHVPVPDQHSPTVSQAEEILGIVEAMAIERRPLFIHCNAGVGRTGTALHLYYLSKGLSMGEAREIIRKRRIQCILLTDVQLQFLGQRTW